MTVVRCAKPEVLCDLPTDRHVVVEASAGTGKTHTLEHLIIELLLDRGRDLTIDQILVVTFTERATSELRQRVRAKLEELAAAGPERDAPGLGPERCWVLDDEARARLRRALHAFDSATIATIHSFCQRVLTEHAFPHQRLFEQELVDGREAFGRAFRAALREDFARDPELQRYLRVAVTTRFPVAKLEEALYDVTRARGRRLPPYDPTRLEAALAAFPVEAVADPGLAAALKAAGMRGTEPRVVLGRLEKVAALVAGWREHRDLARLLYEVETLAAAPAHRQYSLIGHPRARLEAHVFAEEGPARRLRRAFAELADSLVPFTAALVARFAGPIAERLERRKRERGEFDFDDMLTLVGRTLDGPRGAELCRILRGRYRYALIDEFQDTDEVQWRIFRRIFFESGGANLLCVIGDPKQAIYGFRGADVHTYVGARAEILARGGQPVPLRQSFRSTAALVDAVNAILDQQAAPPFFGGADIRYTEPVSCGRPDLRAVNARGEDLTPIRLFELGGPFNVEDALARLGARIAAEVGALLDAERPLLRLVGDAAPEPDREPRPLVARDIFVLTQAAWEGRIIGEALRAAGVPHAFYKEDGLFARPEAADVLDLLWAVEDPRDRSKRLRAWLTPFFGLSLAEAREAGDVAESHPLMRRLLDWRDVAQRKDHARLCARILADSGIVRRALFFRQSERELTNYLHLFELLLEEAARTRATLRELAFVLQGYVDGTRRPLGQDGDVQRLESERAAVQIMTMHKAKGLEAAVVFLAGGFHAPRDRGLVHTYHAGGERLAYVSGGRLPDAVAQAVAAEQREADERLLYVALTRARARLYLPYFPPPEAPAEEGRAPKEPDGCYTRVNERLRALVAAGGAPWLSREVVAAAPAAAAGPPATPADLAAWRPPPGLLATPDDAADFERLRDAHRGFTITSYTRMQREADGARLRRADEAADHRDEAPRGPEVAAPADDLPGGARTGSYLHELLEEVALAPLLAAASPEEWFARPEVAARVRAGARRHGLETRHARRAAELVFTALRAPVALRGGAVIDGLAAAAESVREMEFVYPIPEPGHPRLAEPLPAIAAGGLTITQGFVRGFVDFLFTHAGLSYFADWKSDLLADFTPAALARHVAESYALQARLYALALVKLLGVRTAADYEARFGGLLYCFLRGMRRDGRGTEGVYFHRPSWETMRRWEEDLTRFGELAAARPAGGRA